jgi:hypothetical protein
MPIETQHITSVLTIVGKFYATSHLNNPSLFALALVGFTSYVETRLNMNVPIPTPETIIPPTSPLLFGKYFQQLDIGITY